MTSIPRDLLVDIPGVGNQVKINAAYEAGGERADREDGQEPAVGRRARLQDQPRHHDRLRRLPQGRSTTSAASTPTSTATTSTTSGGPGGYAVIDIDPGYQKLCGTDALDYVRYRHGDNDLVRGARQQDFLRQVRTQKGIRKLLDSDPGNLRARADLRPVLRLRQGPAQQAGPVPVRQDRDLHGQNPVREVRFRVVDAPDHINLDGVGVDARARPSTSSSTRRRRRRRASRPSRRRPTSQASKQRAKRKKNKPSSIPGLEEARDRGREPGDPRVAQDRLPVLLPDAADQQRLLPGDRAADLHDPRREAREARRVPARRSPRASSASTTASRARPGASRRSSTTRTRPIVRNGRKLMVYRDGKRVRLVAWRTPQGGLLGVQHAHAVAQRAADDRHRRVAEAARRLIRLPRRS